MIKYYCDRCGEESDHMSETKCLTHDHIIRNMMNLSFGCASAYLCTSCTKKIIELFKNFIKNK